MLHKFFSNSFSKTFANTAKAGLMLGIFMLASCGGGASKDGASASDGSKGGTTHNTGAFSVQYPKGWEVSTFYMGGEVEPNTLAVHKGSQMDHRLMAIPSMQINFTPSGETDEDAERTAKYSYKELKEMQPVQIGKNTWKGYTGMAASMGGGYNLPVTFLWTYVGDAQIKVAIWTEMGGKKITLNDADVKSIIASITPN